MAKKRIVVTGGSGKAGKWIIREFLNQGYDVLNLDIKKPEEDLCRTLIVDLNDLGQVTNALSLYSGYDRYPVEGVVHFAAIPQAYIVPNDVTYRNNVMSTYNILEASANLGIKKVVLASSESSYGLCFASEFFKPNYVPMDEDHPQLPEDSYGLSKVVNEVTAEAFHRKTGMQVISFRLGNIIVPEDYPKLIEGYSKPEARLRNLWSYIDSRDVAIACRLAVEKDSLGAQALILSADDTSSDLPTKQLLETYLSDVKDIRGPLEDRTCLLSNERIKKVLGWKQQYYWENEK
jgi:nucleoside-diphosphate-sugar epimerase